MGTPSSLELCSDGHEEVAYSGNEGCPACNAIKEKQVEIDNLKEKINELTAEIDDLTT